MSVPSRVFIRGWCYLDALERHPSFAQLSIQRLQFFAEGFGVSFWFLLELHENLRSCLVRLLGLWGLAFSLQRSLFFELSLGSLVFQLQKNIE